MFTLRLRRTTEEQTTLNARTPSASFLQRMTRVALMLTVTAGALLAPKAHADFTFKNDYHKRVWVAINYGGASNCGSDGYWRTLGWWEIAPGQSAVVMRGDLNKLNPSFSYYAQAEDGSTWDDRNAPSYMRYYVNLNAGFDYCGNIGNTQMVIKGFRPVYIGGVTHYTLTLSP
jgi:uncharacterized membrane protein